VAGALIMAAAAVCWMSGDGAGRIASPAGAATASVRTERFDHDPGWDGHNNRATTSPPRTLQQDFGFSRTRHAGRQTGEIGGLITPAAEPAYYARVLRPLSFDDTLSASGTLVVGAGGASEAGASNTLIGFFNADTLKEWRTPNTIALRVNGRGAGFHAHVEYATGRWRAGADFFGAVDPAVGRRRQREFPGGAVVHTWSLRYDPGGNEGGGTITATLDEDTVRVNLEPGHKRDGATFNRFGILNVMKSADGGGFLWLDDLTLNGVPQRFDRDPDWDQRQNRRTYPTRNVRPWFDFGFSATRYARGRASGEVGGLIFRGDERYPERLAYYGDRLEPLDLEQPLEAGGKLCLRRGVTDSTTLVGFFHHSESIRPSTTQRSGIPENFLGIAIEGPSREGFSVYPAYGVDREAAGVAAWKPDSPRLFPDGKSHDWSLEYLPREAGGGGQIRVALDGRTARLDLLPEHRSIGARFNRFGIVTTHIDGNGQHVYLDDLRYTWK
jgi:hypothetical protein